MIINCIHTNTHIILYTHNINFCILKVLMNYKFQFTDATLNFEVELINIGDSAPTTNVFKEIDIDQDKMLSREEVSEYLKKQMESAGEGEAADEVKKMLEDHDKLVEEIFQHEDKDKNGFISHEEFSGPKHDEL